MSAAASTVPSIGLHAANITVAVGRRATRKVLIEDLSLTLTPGEVLALVGPNGAGKSTVLGALAGTRLPNAGAVFIDGSPLAPLVQRQPLALARRRAVLPQAEVMGFPLSVLEVVMLGRHPHLASGMSDARPYDLAIAWRALERVSARHLATQAFPTLSGGERQRVRVARVLAQVSEDLDNSQSSAHPRYLLLDEPAAGLDLAHARALHQLLRSIAHATQVGVVVVEHDLALAATADRVAVLANGRMVACGSPAPTLTAQLLSEVFGLAGGFVSLPAGGLALDLPPLLSPF